MNRFHTALQRNEVQISGACSRVVHHWKNNEFVSVSVLRNTVQPLMHIVVETGLNSYYILSNPNVSNADTLNAQGKFYIEDPDGYVIEVKTYRDVEAVFGEF